MNLLLLFSSWRQSDYCEKDANSQLPDYAEVTAARPTGTFSTFGEKNEELLSPAPYATTTLLPPRTNEQVSVVSNFSIMNPISCKL